MILMGVLLLTVTKLWHPIRHTCNCDNLLDFNVINSAEMLDNYPRIKSVFLFFNITIQLSLPLEKLFSSAALILIGVNPGG